MSNYKGGVRNRRVRALKRLENQLALNEKAEKEYQADRKFNKTAKDSEKIDTDRKVYLGILDQNSFDRITREIQTLKTRI